MSRQLKTLILGAVLVLVLGVVTFVVQVPYVVLSPGPTINTLGKDHGADIIGISGHPVAATTGNLNLVTVSVDTQDATAFRALKGWLAHDEVVVSRDSVYPPGQSQQQTNKQDQQDFLESQNSAITAVACELKYPTGIGVSSVSKTSPNLNVIQPLDRVVSFNGVPVADDATLRAQLAKTKAGDKATLVVARAGKQVTLTVTMAPPASGSTTPQLGIAIIQGCLMPFPVTLALTGIGGPSAGLMFALGIYDRLGTDDLTHGKFIAGTGTISADGTVGAIGGIQLKMMGARRDGATVFLAPESNCGSVRGNIPKGLEVIKVSSLSDAISSLDALNSGSINLPHC